MTKGEFATGLEDLIALAGYDLDAETIIGVLQIALTGMVIDNVKD